MFEIVISYDVAFESVGSFEEVLARFDNVWQADRFYENLSFAPVFAKFILRKVK